MATLYLTTPGSRLELSSGQLVCVKDGHVLLSVPSARVDQVVVVGGSHVTTPALAFLLERDIDLLFVTVSGAFRGRLDTGSHESVAIRRAQYRRADDPDFCLMLARAIITGKIHNARVRCMELDQGDDPASARAIANLKALMTAAEEAPALPELMGIEGRAARWYFGVLRRHLRPPWEFTRRARRPPPDPVNVLLSVAYTLLHEQCRSALIAAGLDPALGYLHQPRSGRASLAVDLMEEFRPVIADAVVWLLCNKRVVSRADFVAGDDGRGMRLTPEGWRHIAEHYTRRLDTGILVPGRTTRTTYRKLLEVQARQLRKVIIGEKEAYEPFRSR